MPWSNETLILMKRDNLTIEASDQKTVAEHSVEIVERKGTGHPDYICDAVMERVSVELSGEYLRRFGRVLHHNIDKGLLVAGQVEKRFGGGRVIKPMELLIGDRATFRAGAEEIPVAAITRKTVRGWFSENLPSIDASRDLRVRVVLQPGSEELSDIFESRKRVMGANDTSAAVGYAPFTPAEKAVFDTERLINSRAFKERFPETGTDVKVMGVRTGRRLDLTVACPLLAGRTGSEKEYFERKKAVTAALRRSLRPLPFDSVNVKMNTLDKPGRGLSGVYLSLLGTSAEDADSGQVGRGNRVNGVISLARPMGTEAAAGKNPTSHVGKIYTVLSHLVAGEIYSEVRGLREVYVWLLSRIGAPVDRPEKVYVKLIPARGADKRRIYREVASIVERSLARIPEFTGELAGGLYPVC